MTSRCGWCNHKDRLLWESRYFHDNEAINVIARDTPFSHSAAHDHLSKHVRDRRRAIVVRDEASQLNVASFMDRVLGLADDAAEIKRAAIESHNPRLALTAQKEERDALGVLMNRLGVDDQDTVDALREAQVLGRALMVTLQDYPEAAKAIAGYLANTSETALADTFGRFAATVGRRSALRPATSKEMTA